VLITTITAVMH